MRRADRYVQIKALRDEGLLLREIAARIGLATSTVHDILADPTGDLARNRKRRYEHPCIDCGETVNPNGISRRGLGRCYRCAGEHERELSRRWIIDSFCEWADLFGGVPPCATDWSAAHARATGREDKVARLVATGRPWPSTSLVQDCFGSWNAGRAAAGFAVNVPGHYGRDGEEPEIIAETVALYRSGFSALEVGERMGCSDSAVLYRLDKADEPRRAGPNGTSGIAYLNAQKTHCPQGHPYDEINTYFDPTGGRSCRTCRRDSSREYQRRKRAA